MFSESDFTNGATASTLYQKIKRDFDDTITYKMNILERRGPITEKSILSEYLNKLYKKIRFAYNNTSVDVAFSNLQAAIRRDDPIETIQPLWNDFINWADEAGFSGDSRQLTMFGGSSRAAIVILLIFAVLILFYVWFKPANIFSAISLPY